MIKENKYNNKNKIKRLNITLLGIWMRLKPMWEMPLPPQEFMSNTK